MENSLDRANDAILITGPTASGKSALAVELAQRHNGEIVNADSMQVYDTLQVLTARPSEAEMGGIPHHLYGTVPAGQAYSTGEWLRSAERAVAGIVSRGKIPILVGGTGLYFKALTGGLSDMPVIPADVREYWRERLRNEGPQTLHAELAKRDPSAAATLNPSDGQRVVRALEVNAASGRSIGDFQEQRGHVVIGADHARKIIVLPDRAVLHDRINQRFGRMFEMGAIEEVRVLLQLGLGPDMPVMKAIGVPQITRMLGGELTPEEVIAQSSAATRQYAKRQMTWFRNQMDESWERIGR
jgi:tRNA dimethylallyltransferase